MDNAPMKPGSVTVQNDDGTTTFQQPDSADLYIYTQF